VGKHRYQYQQVSSLELNVTSLLPHLPKTSLFERGDYLSRFEGAI